MSSKRDEFLSHYDAFKDSIFSYLFYRVGMHRMLAEDLTEDVFLKAFEHFDSYDATRPFKAWIFTIAHNELINFYRQKQGKDISLDEIEGSVIVAEETRIPAQLAASMDVERLMQVLQLLPEASRELLVLKYLNELTYEEIAQITGKEEGTIRVAIHRALKVLHERYEKLFGHP